ncbi:MAG: tetratricopeptide repeat-containing sensor histidine kinase [Ignavibacteria bacterium]|nr:tetratricopeptide repeat-containing sensor histidine kinase [Ignavibacteria bacterium]
MKYFLIIFSVVFSVFGQPQLDSLLRIKKPQDDKTKIKVINEYCLNIRGSNPVLALELATQSLNLAKKISDNHFMAESENLIGVIQRNVGDYNQALVHHLRALKIAEEANDSIQLGFSYNNIGVIYRQRNNLNLATENVIHSLRVFEAINHLDGMAFANLSLGTIFALQKNYASSLTYYQYALNIRHVQGNENEKARTLDHIAAVYLSMEKYDEALKSYQSLEKIYIKGNDKRGLGDCWIGIGKIYSVEKKNKKAIEYFTKALTIFKELDYKEEIAIAAQNLGLTYTKTNNSAAGFPLINQSLSLAYKINSPKLISESLRSTAEFYELISRHDSAMVYLKQYHTLKDSISEAEKFVTLANIEALYQSEKKERENRILMQTIEGQENQKYLLLIIILLIVALGFISVIRNKKLKKINAELKELHAMKDTFLRIIAHDLRAPFNAIFGLTDILLEDYKSLSEEEKRQFIEHIANASKQSYELLENLLLWARTNTGRMDFNPQECKLKSLVDETVQLLEPTAKNKNIQLFSDVPEKIHLTADAEMLKTVLRNFLSNSIKFTSEQDGVINISAVENGNKIRLEVSDNGVGMPEDVQKNLFRIDKSTSTKGTKGEKGTGLGLLLCKEFIDKHNGSITVASKLNEGTKFIIELPRK